MQMKPVDVTSDSYADHNEDFNEKRSKFKAGDCVRISKQKNIFGKGYSQNWSEEVFVVSKIENTVPWTYTVTDLNGDQLLEVFMKKNCKKLVRKSLE